MKAGNLDFQILANSMPSKVEDLNDMPHGPGAPSHRRA